MNELMKVVEKGLGFPLPSFYVVIEAKELAQYYHPPFPPTAPLIIFNLSSKEYAEKIKSILLTVYPPQLQLNYLYTHNESEISNGDVQRKEITLDQLEKENYSDHDVLYIVPPDRESSCEAFQDVVAHLRAPDGCPWDRKQTHQSLRSHLLSETYEVLEALDTQDIHSLCEELGDLLLQIILHAQIAYEMGEFRMTDVFREVHQKIVHRHPHVFGSLELDGVEGVLKNWERLKAEEREARNSYNGEEGNKPKRLLDGLPKSLPALVQSQEYQERAQRVGYGYIALVQLKDKIVTELEILLSKDEDKQVKQQVIGELLFDTASIACQYDIDAESALRAANTRFRKKLYESLQ